MAAATTGTVDVENSLLAGGDYCIYGGAGNKGTVHTGPVTITDNRFSRLFFSTCGQYGAQAYMPSDTTWSGNVWDDTNQTVHDDRTCRTRRPTERKNHRRRCRYVAMAEYRLVMISPVRNESRHLAAVAPPMASRSRPPATALVDLAGLADAATRRVRCFETNDHRRHHHEQLGS